MKKLCVLFLCFIIIFAAYSDPSFAEERCTNYDSAIDRVAEKYIGKSVPGACVVISEHNKIVCAKTYGYADLEKKKRMDLKKMVFEWGSISKTFIWVSVMQLAEQGKLDLNADVRTYLPKGFLKNLNYDKPVTMLHLMNHTAGFEEQLTDLRYLSGNKEYTLAEVLSSHQPEQVFAPGEISAYSNWSAALAAFVVERVSGQDYKEYVKEHILRPLNMRHTSMGPFWNDIPNLAKEKSKGYSFSGNKFKREDAMHLRMYPAGAMNGSVNDLLHYAQELAKGYEKGSILFHDLHTKKEMFTETYRSYGSDVGLSHGFWQYIGNSGILGHEGGTYGFKTQVWIEPEKERVILVLTNVMETEFCSDIMKAVAYKTHNNKRSIKKSPVIDVKLLEGDYLPARSAWKNVGKIQGRKEMISVSAEKDGRLCLNMPFGNKKMYYKHTGANIFVCEDASPEEKVIAFDVKNGKVCSMSFRLAHDYVPAKKTQGKIGSIAGLMTYMLGLMLFLIYLITKIFVTLRRKEKWEWNHFFVAVSGIILGISGIAGMIHWFSVYSVVSYELIAIVIIGWICALTGIVSGVYGCVKKKNLKSSLLLLLFIAQISAAYYLGFLTMI